MGVQPQHHLSWCQKAGRSSEALLPQVEAVLIPPLPEDERGRAANARAHTTLCVSSQVGCRMGCTFCATGRMGLARSLTADEILIQVVAARRVAASAALPPVSNVVFMGMGEPADNADAVRAASAGLVDTQRFAYGQQRVLVSTVAPTPAAFTQLFAPTPLFAPHTDAVAEAESASPQLPLSSRTPLLAWSLHSCEPQLRQLLVPTALASPVQLRDGLVAALAARPDWRSRRVMIEVVLIRGINDGLDDAAELVRFLRPIEAACHAPERRSSRTGVLVNLIPYNGGAEPITDATTDAATDANTDATTDATADGPGGALDAVTRPVPLKLPHYSLFKRPSRASVEAFQQQLRDA